MQQSPMKALHPLARAALFSARQLNRQRHPLAQQGAATLRTAAAQAPRAAALTHFPPAGEILLAQLNALLSRPPALPLRQRAWLAVLADAQPHLPWRAAGGGAVPVLGAVELVGPDGVLPCATLRAGFYYQPPQYFYPRHQHAAEELYLPISGTAEWHADGTAPHCVAPGTLIHHRAWQPHACRTHGEPLLALWLWGGDLSMHTYRFC